MKSANKIFVPHLTEKQIDQLSQLIDFGVSLGFCDYNHYDDLPEKENETATAKDLTEIDKALKKASILYSNTLDAKNG